MKTVIVNVTARDIKLGVANSCDCPIARAFHRIKGFEEVMIWRTSARRRDAYFLFPLSFEMIAFINFFDSFQRDKIKPTKFKIQIPA